MAKKIDIVFQSEKDNDKGYFQIASGHISETTVLFEKENITAVIHAKGRVEFYNMDDELLAVGEVPGIESGRNVYEEVSCKVERNLIIIEFPIYKWIDNYPNCDGEYDRWETRKVGFFTLSFDLVNNKVV